ncbi:MAG: dTMP kinase [Gemmatimonadota bacterium]|nr:dTMP kinase [Gemmatimonadota bacterium]
MAAGKLIVFEGAEGAGKTTQIRLLVERLAAAGFACVKYREPGGTPVGDSIRGILLDPEREIGAETESLLFMASRAELIATEVRPALERGAVVILDRFFLSTYAYQISGRGLAERDVRAANHLATGGLVPDITLLLDVSAEEGLARAERRGGRDRMERTGDGFHDRVNAAFGLFAGKEWQDSHAECGRIVRITGTGRESDIAALIDDALAGVLKGVPRPMVKAGS